MNPVVKACGLLALLAFPNCGGIAYFFLGDVGSREEIKRKGELVLMTKGSFLRFARDGTFHASPVGMSGRILNGSWTATGTDPATFTATVRTGWLNGLSPTERYRRLVITVHRGHTRPFYHTLTYSRIHVFTGSFSIDEDRAVPQPKGEKGSL